MVTSNDEQKIMSPDDIVSRPNSSSDSNSNKHSFYLSKDNVQAFIVGEEKSDSDMTLRTQTGFTFRPDAKDKA